MNTKKNTLWIALSVLMMAAFVLGACAPAATPAPTQAPAAQPTQAPAANPQPPLRPQAPAATRAAAPTQAAAATGSFLDRAMAGEFKGKTVTATGPFVDADAQKFNCHDEGLSG